MDDWVGAVESASWLIRDVLSAQTIGVRILQTIREPKATTERIGWLNYMVENLCRSGDHM